MTCRITCNGAGRCGLVLLAVALLWGLPGVTAAQGIVSHEAIARTGVARSSPPEPTARAGVIDLREWDFERDGTVTLNGEWEFFWNQLLSPDDFSEAAAEGADAPSTPGNHIPVPRVWNGLEVDGITLEGGGYGTYRLVILVAPGDGYAVKILDAANAYALWAGGTPLFVSGTVGTDRASMVPRYRTGTADLSAPDGVIELVVHVSNFVHRRGGMWLPWEFGPESLIEEKRERNLLVEFVLFGSIGIIGIYHLGLFFLRRKERTALYFGLFCILIALRIVVTGERIFNNLVPSLSWDFFNRIEYLTFYMGPPVFVFFLRSLFPELSRRVARADMAMGALFSLVVLITPPLFFTHTLPFYQAITLVVAIYAIYAVVRAVAHHRQGARMVAFGSIILVGTLAHDIILENGWIQGIHVAPIGTILFVFIQAFMLSRRFSSALSLAEELSTELELKVEERTQQLRETQSQLIQSQKMEAMGTLAGGIAHEFNNILGAQLGYTEILLDRVDADTREGEYLQALYRTGERAAALVRQILTFSRGDGERLKAQRIQSHVRETLHMVRTTLPRSIDLIQSIDPDCGAIMANETQVSQVVVNLCTNAVHAMKGRSGRLEVSLGEEPAGDEGASPGERSVVLRVRDTGTGIPEEVRDRIFDPFFTTKEVGEGSGLGLSIVHGIVTGHHGTIEVVSAPGEGTEFVIRFPRIDEEEAEEAMPRSSLRTGSARIMIVEDDPELSSFYEATLKELGYATELHHDGADALDSFRRNPGSFDVVFTDQIMSGLSGFDMSREMLRIRPDVAIILSSGFSATVTEDAVRELGVEYFLPKPVKIAELTGKIWELVHR